MKIELCEDELMLMDMLLSKEEAELKIEVHHCKNYSYKNYLKECEGQVGTVLAKIRDAVAVKA